MSLRDEKDPSRPIPFLDRLGANRRFLKERGDVRLVYIILRIIFSFPSFAAPRSTNV